LKEIYLAPSEDAASDALERFAEKWDRKYPAISKSWRNRWMRTIGSRDNPAHEIFP
jgi:transposase-like protein